MERNRVLWVIFSISLFLVVVLAGGLYLLRPVTDKNAGVAGGQAPSFRGFDAFEYVRGKSELPTLAEEPEEAEEMVIIVGEREEAPSAEPETALQPPEKAVPPVPETRPGETGSTAAAPAAKSPVTRPAATGSTPRRVAGSPSTRAPAARPETKPTPREVNVTEYWIQAGSYTSPSRAQEIAVVLEDQGLASKITTRSMSGKTYYRVRIGPYLSKAEAEKFLEWVKAVKGFESSYISMVYAKRRNP